MSLRSDLKAKGIALTVDMKLQLSIIDSKHLWDLPPNFPADQPQARKLLNNFFSCRRMESRYSKEPHDYILNVLRRYPNLASKQFGQRRRFSKRACPFFHLVAAKGVAVDTLQEIYEIDKDAIEEEAKLDSYFPLHYACEACVDGDVIAFLINTYRPAVISQRKPNGKLPLHYALSMFQTPPRTIQLLVEAFSQSLAVRANEYHFSPLDCALNHSCNPLLLKALVDLSRPQDLEELRIGNDEFMDIRRGPPELLQACLDVLAPYVKRVVWDLCAWSEEQVVTIIRFFRRQCIELGLSPYMHGTNPRKFEIIWNEAWKFIISSKLLKHLHISNNICTKSGQYYDFGIDHLDIIWQNLHYSRIFDLKSITFECFQFSLDIKAHLTILVLNHVKQLKLVGCRLVNHNALPQWRDSRLESVSICDSPTDTITFMALLEEISCRAISFSFYPKGGTPKIATTG